MNKVISGLLFVLLGPALAWANPTTLAYRVCDQDPQEMKIEASKMLQEGQPAEEVYKWADELCKQVEKKTSVPESFNNMIITNTGNVSYERIESCGYHPQRQEFTCTMAKLRNTGYGGTPFAGPGSFEWLTLCVNDNTGAGLRFMNISQVHVHDNASNHGPNWYYAIEVPDDWMMQLTRRQGQTFHARAILSWLWPITNCTGAPIWGNQADFPIKLDP